LFSPRGTDAGFIIRDDSHIIGVVIVTVLVTGGSGFVGANIVKHLAANDRDVVCFSRSAEDTDPLLDWYFQEKESQIHRFAGDVLDEQQLREAVDQFDVSQIVHTAAITPSPEAERNRAEFILSVNILGTSNVLDVARDTGVERVVYTSSGAVYKNNSELEAIDEYDGLDLNGLYPISKHSSEELCRYYDNRFGVSTVNARLGWIYGHMERPLSSRTSMSEVFNAMTAAIEGETLQTNDPRRYRDWTHGQDVARGVRLLLETDELGEPTYNLTAGRGHPVSEVLDCITEMVDSTAVEQVVNRSDANVPVSTGGRRGPLGIDRLQRDTGFEPAFSLQDGLRDYRDWLAEAKANDLL
jgi:nucleoside-diphosphate-sugar epimerase